MDIEPGKNELSINCFLNAKTELLPLLVIYGKLVRTTMFNTVFAINGTLFFPCAQENTIIGKY